LRILVTGAGGFVGRALVSALAPDHDVIAVDRVCDGLAGADCRIWEGDFADPALLDQALADGCDAAVHLATVPGGAAEQNPALAFDVNVSASARLIDRVAAASPSPRFIFASSIAVFGDPMPTLVDDASPLCPRLVYGAHKAMIEQWIATMTRRGAIRGLSLRFPGIVARPRGVSGMKSAFMSDLFHAAIAHEPFAAPVSPGATMWLMSVSRLVANIAHALHGAPPAEPYALTLPALRTTMAELAQEVARQTGAAPSLVRYDPDPALEAGFGRQPPLETPTADAAGFRHDGSLEALVTAALRNISESDFA